MDRNERIKRQLGEIDAVSLTKEDIYVNQVEIAKECIKKFVSWSDNSNENDGRNQHIMLMSKPQSGKTGVCNSIINILEKHKSLKEYFGIKKYVYATGMNDNALRDQTKERLSRDCKINVGSITSDEITSENLEYDNFYVFKNSNFKKLKNLAALRDCILFIDESHYGSKEGQELSEFLDDNELNWRNEKMKLKEKNVYIVSVSATAFVETYSDVLNVKGKIILNTAENYFGIKEFYDNSLIRSTSSDDFSTKTKPKIIEYLMDAHDRILSKGSHKGMVIVRNLQNKIDFNKNKEVCEKFHIVNFDSDTHKKGLILENIKSIDHMLEDKIKKPLLIVIKGAFRAGITIQETHKKLIYMIYDDAGEIHTTVQGLLGRMCGYRQDVDSVSNTIFYVNEDHVKKYIEWEDKNFDRSYIPIKKNDANFIHRNLKTKLLKVEPYPLTDKELASLKKYFLENNKKNQCTNITNWFKKRKKINLRKISDSNEETDLAGSYHLGELIGRKYARTVEGKIGFKPKKGDDPSKLKNKTYTNIRFKKDSKTIVAEHRQIIYFKEPANPNYDSSKDTSLT